MLALMDVFVLIVFSLFLNVSEGWMATMMNVYNVKKEELMAIDVSLYIFILNIRLFRRSQLWNDAPFITASTCSLMILFYYI